MYRKIALIISLLMLIGLILTDRSQSDERRILGFQKDDGTYNTLLNPGQCKLVENTKVCVLYEKVTRGGWIHQYMDYDGDSVCDNVATWRKFEDPTYGVFYAFNGTIRCEDSL